MRLKNTFEIVDVTGEYMAVPVGAEAETFGGVIALSETAAFLLKQMESPKTVEELTGLLTQQYEISEKAAAEDISTAIEQFRELGIIEE